MGMKLGQICEAPMLLGDEPCALPSGHRGAHQLDDGTEYFTSAHDGTVPQTVRGASSPATPAKAFRPAGIHYVIGPVYSTRAVMTMLRVSRSTVSKRVKDGQLLTLKVKGRSLFPAFQFADQQVRHDVLKIVDELRGVADPFTIAQWLKTPMADDPKVRTPLAALDAGRHQVALRAARRAAARWSA